jgi:CubicO group peptidase (beta-lactamase class C family)
MKSTLDERLRKTIQRHQPVEHTGVAVAVVKEGQLWFHEGYGLRQRGDSSSRVTSLTSFGIGSVTKPFTSLAWAIHAETARISLDEPILRRDSAIALKDRGKTRQITVRDILAHRTGLPRHDALWYLGGYSADKLVERLQYLDPSDLTEFRGKGRYNNLMYTAAGQLLGRNVAEEWADYVQRIILDPLEMNHTTFAVEALKHAQEYAAPYRKNTPMEPKDVTNIAPAGAINSNALDMAKWMQLFLRGGETRDGNPILSPEGVEELFRSETPIEFRGQQIHYGLGWFISSRGEHKVVHHTGATDGYSAIVALVPAVGMGVCVLTSQHQSCLPDRVAETALEVILGRAGGRRRWRLSKDPRRDWVGLISLAPPSPSGPPVSDDTYEGIYSDPGYGDMRISNADGKRWLHWTHNRWRLRRAPPWFLPVFCFWIEGYGRRRIVPLWIRNEPNGGKSFGIPFEATVSKIRFYRG